LYYLKFDSPKYLNQLSICKHKTCRKNLPAVLLPLVRYLSLLEYSFDLEKSINISIKNLAILSYKSDSIEDIFKNLKIYLESKTYENLNTNIEFDKFAFNLLTRLTKYFTDKLKNSQEDTIKVVQSQNFLQSLKEDVIDINLSSSSHYKQFPIDLNLIKATPTQLTGLTGREKIFSYQKFLKIIDNDFILNEKERTLYPKNETFYHATDNDTSLLQISDAKLLFRKYAQLRRKYNLEKQNFNKNQQYYLIINQSQNLNLKKFLTLLSFLPNPITHNKKTNISLNKHELLILPWFLGKFLEPYLLAEKLPFQAIALSEINDSIYETFRQLLKENPKYPNLPAEEFKDIFIISKHI